MIGPNVQLPLGVHDVHVQAHADTWHAWDVLTVENGWRERSWWINHTGQCEPDAPDARFHVQKEAERDGARVVIHPPLAGREAEILRAGVVFPRGSA